MAIFTPSEIPDYSNADCQALLSLGSIDGIGDFQEILSQYQQLKQQFSPKKILLILQDRWQAEYTSVHASMSEELYYAESDDVLDVDHPDHPFLEETQVNPARVKHYAHQLAKAEFRQTLAACAEKMASLSADDKKAFICINQNPLPIMDKNVVVLAGMFDREPLKLALQVNGYFSTYFNPFENLVMIELMADFGFEFIGLGADILGFMKTDECHAENLSTLADQIALVYHFDDGQKAQLHQLLLKNHYAILSYCESPSERFLDFYE